VLSIVARILLLFVAALQICGRQLTDHVKAVENGLLPAVVIKGRPVQPANIAERMKALNVRGVSIAVINNYEIEWAKGYGFADVASKRPVEITTLFQAGSISKPVAAVAAMKLVDEGKLALDRDINTFLTSWKVPDNEFTKDKKVTLREILSHSAGLTVHGFPGYAAGEPLPTVVQILDGVKPANTAPIRVDVVPGSIWRYSGGGYTVMQLAMTDVTHKPFPEIMRETVLTKAGMRDSTYDNPLPSRLSDVAATGYGSDGTPVAGRYHTYPEMAAAGLWTTPSDLARFGIEMQKSREGRSNRILKQATVQEMLTEQKKPWGLGFELAPNWFSHGGADDGFQASFGCSLDGKGLVVMTNSDNGGRLAHEIELAFAAVYGLAQKPTEREMIPMPPEEMQKFTGTYSADVLGKVSIRVEGDHLLVTNERIGSFQLFPASGRRFFSLGVAPDVTFSVDDHGIATGFIAGNVKATKLQG
jgi:CubicO group peptidase (beta-lactamase class C family)